MRLITAPEFTQIDPWQVGSPSVITLDAENVLTGYGDPTLLPKALGMICDLGRIAPVAIATNNKNQEYIAELTNQLPTDVPVFSVLQHENKKKGPGMFLAAAAHFEADPREGIHVDDQVLSMWGAYKAGFDGILVKPHGPNSHKGVRLGRPLDKLMRGAMLLRQNIELIRTDGIDG